MSSEEVMREVIQDAILLSVSSDDSLFSSDSTSNYNVDISRLWNNMNNKYKKFKVEVLSVSATTAYKDYTSIGDWYNNAPIYLSVDFKNAYHQIVSSNQSNSNYITILKNIAVPTVYFDTIQEAVVYDMYSYLEVQNNSIIISRPNSTILQVSFIQNGTYLEIYGISGAGGDMPDNSVMFRITPLI